MFFTTASNRAGVSAISKTICRFSAVNWEGREEEGEREKGSGWAEGEWRERG